MSCKICKTKRESFDNSVILKKYNVQYYICPNCGFIQTEEPYWMCEAYTEAIADLDIGIIQRNLYLSTIVSATLKVCFADKNRFLDYGAGYGIFVRMMRDKGFKFYWQDKYSTNLFAKTFIGEGGGYEIITAMELFEHFDDPINEMKKILEYGDTIIFSTELLPVDFPKVKDWWYYVPETGQHISFYTEKSLSILANYFNKNYVHYKNIHIFSEKKVSRTTLKLCVEFAQYINFFIKKESLLMKDYCLVKNKL